MATGIQKTINAVEIHSFGNIVGAPTNLDVINNEPGVYDVYLYCVAGTPNIQVSNNGSTWRAVKIFAVQETFVMKDVYLEYLRLALAATETFNYYVIKKT